MRIYVACSSEDKGAIARKACKVACIGCRKCVKVCPHDAIVVENNLAYIDFTKCKLCYKCVDECPTGSILAVNFPVRKQKSTPKTEQKPVSKLKKEEVTKNVKEE